MGQIRVCWNRYALHVREWYVTTYCSSQGDRQAMKDGDKLNSAITYYGDQFSEEHSLWNADVMGDLIAERAEDIGTSSYATQTARLYIKNTAKSFMDRCIGDTGGFAEDVTCWCDSDCPRGYRCRGVGSESECVKDIDPYEEEPSIIPLLGGSSTIGIDWGLGDVPWKIIGAVLFVLAFLVALGYSGLGGAAGKAAEKRV